MYTKPWKYDTFYKFAKAYKNNIDSFLKFISQSEFSVKMPYRQSWDFIKNDLNSFGRYTNLALGFKQQDMGEAGKNYSRKEVRWQDFFLLSDYLYVLGKDQMYLISDFIWDFTFWNLIIIHHLPQRFQRCFKSVLMNSI